MKLVTFAHSGNTRIGVVVDGEVADGCRAPVPQEMIELIAAGRPALQALKVLVDSKAHRIPVDEVLLRAPVLRPGKFLAIGLNYLEHIEETELKPPEFPVFFNKQTTCVNGPY
ncbi:MAG: fumarylacetoacetate hydrolase family protein, partial [Gammaproteobacteria bacterium]